MYCNLNLSLISGKNGGCSRSNSLTKNCKKVKIFFLSLLINGIDSWVFCKTSLVPFITYILAIKIGWAVFEKNGFVDFPNFFITFVKIFFLIWRPGSQNRLTLNFFKMRFFLHFRNLLWRADTTSLSELWYLFFYWLLKMPEKVTHRGIGSQNLLSPYRLWWRIRVFSASGEVFRKLRYF